MTAAEAPDPEGLRDDWHGARFRVGRSVGRTVYLQSGSKPSKSDRLIGLLDTRELAALVVAALEEFVNGEAAS